MSETLEKLRKVLLGMRLYEKCAQNGVSNEELENRLSMLQNRNCLTNCDLQDLVNVCQLNTEPRRGCATSIDLEIAKDTPCNEYFEQEDCSICLDSLSEGETEYAGKCGHLFHEACLKRYLSTLPQRNYRCPTCRGEVFQKFFENSRQQRQPREEVLDFQFVDDDGFQVVDDEEELLNILLREPEITATLRDEQYRIFFGEHFVTDTNEDSIDDFKEGIVPLVNDKVIDLFTREYRRLLPSMQRVWDELTRRGRNDISDLNIVRPTEENIRTIITIADRIEPETSARTMDINVSMYEFIVTYIIDIIGNDEDLVERFEPYFNIFQFYENKDMFLAAVLLMVPPFIKDLEESQLENELPPFDSDSDEY